MTLIERLDDVRERWNVLRHPFYVRWECGELTREELAVYAGQYRHATAALAAAAEQAAELAGPEHAAEEAAHVGLWDGFVDAVKGERSAEPLPETARCVTAWTAASDPLEALAVLYAIEASQGDVSRTKLAGLVEHYGFSPDSAGTAYFELHSARDEEHAAHSRELLEASGVARRDEDRLVAAAEGALAANWALLDGVSREG